jgi:hypothetical protein
MKTGAPSRMVRDLHRGGARRRSALACAASRRRTSSSSPPADLGVAPDVCVVIEDAPAGLAAARAAGMTVVAVPDPAWIGGARFVGADLIVGSLAEPTRTGLLGAG